MKKIFFLAAITISLFAAGQMKEGKVLYERTIRMQFRGNMPPAMENNVPRERKDKFELSFANNQSLWESIPEVDDNNDAGAGGDGNRVMMRFGGGDDLSYHNFTTGKRIDQRELSSKNYIVEDSIQKLDWKLTGETKTILGHTVQQAKTERYSSRMVMNMENGEMKREMRPDTSVIVAWIAMDIPVSAGPDFQGQLPGLMLELNMNNGQMVYKALEISAKVNANAVKEPKGGKHITAADFTKLRDKEFEDMRRNMPAGGGRRIQIVAQ